MSLENDGAAGRWGNLAKGTAVVTSPAGGANGETDMDRSFLAINISGLVVAGLILLAGFVT